MIVGGGLAGIAAFDAITESLASVPGLPPGFSVTMVEGSDAGLGGRAISEATTGPSARHPFAPYDTHSPHGIHFVWGSYDHTYRLMGPALAPRLFPNPGTETYCLWLAPPDIPGDDTSESRVVGFHICNPKTPEQAWRPQARRVLRAFERASPASRVLEQLILRIFGIRIATDDLLSYMDILFDEENIGPELRWTMFLTGALTGAMGAPETNELLHKLLGRAPQDAEIGELMRPLWSDWARGNLERAARFLAPPLLVRGGAWGEVAPDDGPPTTLLGRLRNDAQAIQDFVALLVRDAARVAVRGSYYDPRESGYVKNILKAAFSSPYGLDVATSVRDAQFGVQNHEGAVLQLFDGDDSRGVWEAIAARGEAKGPSAGFTSEIRRARVVAKVELDGTGQRVERVHLSDTVDRAPPDVPTLRPATPGPVTETLDADVAIVTAMPACIPAMLPDAPPELIEPLAELGRFANDTINLQLFFPRRMELPFPSVPAGSAETPPFGISNFEGPFTIMVDLRRGWSPAAFRKIRLEASDPPDSFDGSAWELVGNYADFYSHDSRAHRSRHQWPLAVQQQLAALLQDPSEMDPSALDTRAWVHDVGAPGRLPPPILGEVLPAHRAAYQARWSTEAGPIIVAETLRQLAALPRMASDDVRYLRAQAELVASSGAHEVKWVLRRNAHAETRFFSAEPGVYRFRPHARFPTRVEGLWFAGDWTRNGLNVQAMEPAIISGLQAAAGVLETMRAQGLDLRVLPTIDVSVLPDGAWDGGSPP